MARQPTWADVPRNPDGTFRPRAGGGGGGCLLWIVAAAGAVLGLIVGVAL